MSVRFLLMNCSLTSRSLTFSWHKRILWATSAFNRSYHMDKLIFRYSLIHKRCNFEWFSEKSSFCQWQFANRETLIIPNKVYPIPYFCLALELSLIKQKSYNTFFIIPFFALYSIGNPKLIFIFRIFRFFVNNLEFLQNHTEIKFFKMWIGLTF